MAQHHLDARVTLPRWDRHAPPRLTIASGDTVICDCPEPCGQVTPDWQSADLAKRWDSSKVHALIGPIDVKDAAAGGSVDVQVLALQHHGWAWTGLIPGFGLLHDEFPDPYLHHWRLEGDRCDFQLADITLPYQPFLGCVGVAPATDQPLDTIPPRDNGGNLDIKQLGVGTTIRLPVFRDGAGISIGDGHARQGDGEVCGTAVEAPLRATVRITARPDIPAGPIRITCGHTRPVADASTVFVAVGPDIHEAARDAVRQCVDHLAAHFSIRREQAMALASATCDLRLSQIVNTPNHTVTAHLPDLHR